MEAHGDLLLRHAIGDQVLLHRQRPASRQIAIDQSIAAIVGVTVELDAIHAGVGTQVLQNDVELGTSQRVERHIAAGKPICDWRT